MNALAGNLSTAMIQNLFSAASADTLSGKAQALTTSSLRTSLTGHVAAALPGGVLVIEAERQIAMNNERQTVILRAWSALAILRRIVAFLRMRSATWNWN